SFLLTGCMSIPLEDNFSDIIGKAVRGLKLTPTDLGTRAGIPPSQVQRVCEGGLDEQVLRKIAPLLGLNADALLVSARKAWRPQPITIDGLAQFNTPFDDMTVNAYLLWDPSSRDAAAFDTGADCTAVLDLLAQKKLNLKSI